ncbi:MAG TPA: hypothetical protein PLI95_20930, partial [Polyangiaceae bacterium]|nr:hypothetical protein [Polyangiaceae bacterium]
MSVVIPLKKAARARKTRRRKGSSANGTSAGATPRVPSRGSLKKLIDESRRWLAIINAHKLNEYRR